MASLKTQLVVLAMMSCSLTALADEPLRFVSDVWPPYQYEDEQGQAKGICVELVSKVFQRLGKQVKIEFLPWQRAQKKFANGEYDGQLCVGKNEQRLKLGTFPEQALVQTKWYAFKNKHNAKTPSINKLSDFNNFYVGLVEGSSYTFDVWQYFSPNPDSHRLLADDVQGVKMLNYARLDYIIGNQYNIGFLANSVLKGQSNLEQASGLLFEVPLYGLFSNKHPLPVSAQEFSSQLAQLKGSAEYQQILAKYR